MLRAPNLKFIIILALVAAIGCAGRKESPRQQQGGVGISAGNHAEPPIEETFVPIQRPGGGLPAPGEIQSGDTPLPQKKKPEPEKVKPGQGSTNPPAVPPGELFPKDKFYVGMRTSALGADREFLLYGSLIPQDNQPTGEGLQARIVRFKRSGDKVFLMESNEGHVVTDQLPSLRKIAELPIIGERDGIITLDFNAGMDKVMNATSMYSVDSSDDSKTYKNQGNFIRLEQTHLELVRTVENILEIHQYGNATDDGVVTPYVVRYFITPYAKNPAFEPKEVDHERYLGYFTVAPQLETDSGRSVVYIARWALDAKKPLTYYISANTPEKYRRAVREGVLYWNQAFGKTVLNVEQLADPAITAPDPRYNIIQWVPNDSAGYAYADVLIDPRTGEIQHGQVYLPSAFAADMGQKALTSLRKVNSSNQRALTKAADQARARREKRAGKPRGLRGVFTSARRCANRIDHRFDFHRADAALAGVPPDAKDQLAAGDRLAQDSIRDTVAHEVGHTLGLLHNFAGSMALTMPLTERDAIFEKYLSQGEEPSADHVFASTTMDYLTYEDDTLVGAQMKKPHALSYDLAAIRWAYLNDEKAIDLSNPPLFCNDDQAGEVGVPNTFPPETGFLDCYQFDSGHDPVRFNAWRLEKAIKGLPKTFTELFIMAKTSGLPEDRVALAEVNVKAEDLAESVVAPFKAQLEYFVQRKNHALISERLGVPADDLSTPKLIKKQYEDIFRQLIELAGAKSGTAVTPELVSSGLDLALFRVLPAFDRTEPNALSSLEARATQELENYLNSPSVRSGIGYDGKPYELSAEDLAAIRQHAAKIFKSVSIKVAEAALAILTGTKDNHFPYDTPFAVSLEAKLGAVAKELITAQDPATTASKLPLYRYKQIGMRRKAIKLVTPELGSVETWSSRNNWEIANVLKSQIDQPFAPKSAPTSCEEVFKMGREAYDWLYLQRSMLGYLSGAESGWKCE